MDSEAKYVLAFCDGGDTTNLPVAGPWLHGCASSPLITGRYRGGFHPQQVRGSRLGIHLPVQNSDTHVASLARRTPKTATAALPQPD